MYKRLILTALVCLFFAANASAERHVVKAVPNDFAISIEESNYDRTVINFEIGAYDKVPVEIDGETYYQISYKEGSNLLIKGEPSLPRICKSIIIPDDAEVRINVLSSEYIDIPETPVAPSKGVIYRNTDPAGIPYTMGPVYNTSLWYPSQLAGLRRPYIMRDYRGTVIELSAFRYNPATKTLRVYTTVTVEVITVGTSTINIIENRKPGAKILPEFEQLYQRRFINYEEQAIIQSSPDLSLSRYSAVGEAGDMLIITHDAFHSALLPLAGWKMQKGIRTTIVDVSSIGNNETDIKAYIQSFYDNPDYNLGWVLLVGDAAEVAPAYVTDGASDPSYSKLAGDDDYPDIFIGRFSAQSLADVETQVTRTIDYEKNPAGTYWFHKATGIASDQGDGIGHDGGEIDYEHMEYIRQDLLGFTYTVVDAIYDPGASHYTVSAALNEGRSFVNYAGHGSTTSWSTTNFGTYHINNLTNDNKLPLVISVGCVNGNFTGTTVCFAETWLRATNMGVATGAIGAYMSSINQSWAPPMDAQDEAVDLLVAREKTTIGGICFNGSCKMIDENGSAGVAMFDTWHIFGDPSVLIWTDTPSPLTVYHNSLILSDQTEFSLEVVGEVGALCALYADGVLYGSAYTDVNGLATIAIDKTLPAVGQTVTLTVTAFNGLPYIVDLDVNSSSEALVIYDTYSINDITGNNNVLADAGESIQLGMQLENIGPGEALGVEATLSSSDSYVTINDAYETFGDIPGSNGTSFVADAFDFDIDVNTPDDYNISFHLEITGTESTVWTSDFSIPVHRPDLGFISVTVDDAAGNANGVLDPGETAEIVVSIENTGSGLAAVITGVLSESDPFVTVDDADGSFGDLAGGGGTGDNQSDVFIISADPSSLTGYPVTLDLELTDINGYTTIVNIDLVVGDREIFYSDDFSVNKGWTGLGGDAEWTIGPAAGGVGDDAYGSPDPEFDTSPTEDNNVLGNDLEPDTGGDYNSQIPDTNWVVSPIYDCTDYIGIQLVFNRWLGVESHQYDHVFIEAYDGSGWVQIYENIETVEDIAWQEAAFDLSAVADNNPDFRLRFGLGPTDTYWQYCGWNIDDLILKGYYRGETGNPSFAFSPEELSATVYQNYFGEDTLHIFNNGDAVLRIRFTGGESWIVPPDELIYVPVDGSVDIEITLNETGLPAGDYVGTVDFSSNQRDFRNGTIPVNLTVMPTYLCGDADSDGGINILDVVYLINDIYKDGPSPDPPECGDVNSDGNLDILDITLIINFIYKEGREPNCPHDF
ncbi:MAG TPA: hypothetical protein ENL22_04920 [candidate division Zixibacteria bacterium]|nr:hypothetical protein [candidate division Zixibacteria bacterium]